MAKNIEVVESFVNGGDRPKTANVVIEGDKLFNYGTVIAERKMKANGSYEITLNATKYSRTTSTIQNMVRRSTPDRLLKEVDGIRMGAYSLS